MKKRVRLTFAEWWNWLMGREFVLNRHTNEVHDLTRKHVNCHLELMTDKKYIRHMDVLDLFCDETNVNGCRFCYKEQDNG